MNNWLLNVCGVEEFKGIDVTKIYALDETTLIATDGKRVHALFNVDTKGFPAPPAKVAGMFKSTEDTVIAQKIESWAWVPSGVENELVHFFEGVLIKETFYRDATSDEERACFISEDPKGPILFEGESSKAYVMPLYARQAPK